MVSEGDKVYCKVCNNLYVDDDEYICGGCVEKWRKSLIKKGYNQALEDVIQKLDECFYVQAVDCVEDMQDELAKKDINEGVKE